MRKNGDKWEMVSVGPTTSMRMESFEREFIEQTGVKLVVGKGGMGPLTEEGCQKFKALHVIFPAGCAVLAATQVEEIEEVHWTELGMPESLWVCRVKEFGPLIVSIDTHGNNLIAENKSCSPNAAIPSWKRSASTSTTSNNPHGGSPLSFFAGITR